MKHIKHSIAVAGLAIALAAGFGNPLTAGADNSDESCVVTEGDTACETPETGYELQARPRWIR